MLLDPKSIPKNHVLLNPSIAGDMIYIRDIEQTATQHVNHVVLHNKNTGTTMKVDVPMDMIAPSLGYYVGLEDLRLCLFNGRTYFTATCTHASMRQQSEMVIGVFSEDCHSIEGLCHVDFGIPPVKNVCPFVRDGALMLIDTYNEAIYKVDVGPDAVKFTINVTKVVDLHGPYFSVFSTGGPTSTMRGSTSPVHIHGDTWGCLVHDIIYDDNVALNTKAKLAYMHAWIEFDVATGAITFVSSPFYLAKFGIEFASGITYDKSEGVVTIYMGVEDRVAVVITTTLHHLRS